MPKDYKSFCMVAAHLVRNAHRYYETNAEEVKEELNNIEHSLESYSEPEDRCRVVNQKLNLVRSLKRQNRIREQQKIVVQLKLDVGS